jgi:hypothetical protein
VQILATPAIGDVKILVHAVSLSFRARRGKLAARLVVGLFERSLAAGAFA